MTVTTVATQTVISDSTIFLRDKLRTNITDPIDSTRPSAEEFILTAYPQRAVTYPVITIVNTNLSGPARLGVGSELHELRIETEIRIWARNVKQRDELTQQVMNYLRGIEDDSGGTNEANLHDLMYVSAVNVDEEGEAGIHSKVLQVRYMFIYGA